MVPKVGMDDASIEDAIASHQTDERFVAAIADGATQAFAAARWARLLVEHFASRPRVSRVSQTWLNPAKEAYRAQIDFAQLPWHALEKASRGSFSTLLGLVIDRARRRYRAISVGDSCLVVVDGSALTTRVRVFPPNLSDTAAFTNNPYLIATNPPYNARLMQMQYHMRAWRSLPAPATFLLMTDALAAWVMGTDGPRQNRWDRLTGLHSHDEFVSLVVDERQAGHMRDDDTTLLLVHVSGPSA